MANRNGDIPFELPKSQSTMFQKDGVPPISRMLSGLGTLSSSDFRNAKRLFRNRCANEPGLLTSTNLEYKKLNEFREFYPKPHGLVAAFATDQMCILVGAGRLQ